MKKLITIISVILISSSVYAQSSEIIATSYKQVFKVNGNWGEWPNHWTTYQSEGRSNPVMRITKISLGSYRIQMYIDNKVEADIYVNYDSQESARMRKQWDDKYVNCYKDVSGDYVYTQKISLESISKDNSAWSNDEDSIVYLMIYSEDYCVAVR